ncbi:zinc finger protein 37-like isoform X2 [Pygocentrus nattereri]|uniref:zinc finger protein 37-like isoform X2 n=1 Tax=Pygocentrus nattereri TaxID=42514 RepID=UPI001891538B|nr:zinc finger protein 37-like isoform X2 [Pygocentrus nattereri]
MLFLPPAKGESCGTKDFQTKLSQELNQSQNNENISARVKTESDEDPIWACYAALEKQWDSDATGIKTGDPWIKSEPSELDKHDPMTIRVSNQNALSTLQERGPQANSAAALSSITVKDEEPIWGCYRSITGTVVDYHSQPSSGNTSQQAFQCPLAGLAQCIANIDRFSCSVSSKRLTTPTQVMSTVHQTKDPVQQKTQASGKQHLKNCTSKSFSANKPSELVGQPVYRPQPLASLTQCILDLDSFSCPVSSKKLTTPTQVMSPVHQTKDPVQQKAQPSGKQHLKDCTSKSFSANKPSELVGQPVYRPQPLASLTQCIADLDNFSCSVSSKKLTTPTQVMSPVHQTKDPIQQKAQPSGKQHLKDCTSKSITAYKPSELVGRPVYHPQPLRDTIVHQKLKVPKVILVPLSSCPVDNVPNVTLKQAHALNYSKPEAQQTTNKVNSPYAGQQGQTGKCGEENRLQLRSAQEKMLEKTNKASCRYCQHCQQNIRSHYKEGGPYKIPSTSKLSNLPRNWKCCKCDVAFTQPGNLSYHLAKKHKSSFPCQKCGMAFDTKNKLQYHKYSHESSVSCDKCGKVCRSTFHLRYHKFIHNEDAVKHFCELCGKGFRLKSSLQVHMTVHTDERRHECPDCKATFKVSSHLARHRLMHTDSRPFSCPVCKIGFRTKANVQAHLKTHEKRSGERKRGMRKRKRKLSESEEEWQEEDDVEEEGDESDEEEDEHDEEENVE